VFREQDPAVVVDHQAPAGLPQRKAGTRFRQQLLDDRCLACLIRVPINGKQPGELILDGCVAFGGPRVGTQMVAQMDVVQVRWRARDHQVQVMVRMPRLAAKAPRPGIGYRARRRLVSSRRHLTVRMCAGSDTGQGGYGARRYMAARLST